MPEVRVGMMKLSLQCTQHRVRRGSLFETTKDSDSESANRIAITGYQTTNFGQDVLSRQMGLVESIEVFQLLDSPGKEYAVHVLDGSHDPFVALRRKSVPSVIVKEF